MVNTNGLDCKGIAEYQMILIRANREQLSAMMVMLEAEIAKRNLLKNIEITQIEKEFNINKVLFPNNEDW